MVESENRDETRIACSLDLSESSLSSSAFSSFFLSDFPVGRTNGHSKQIDAHTSERSTRTKRTNADTHRRRRRRGTSRSPARLRSRESTDGNRYPRTNRRYPRTRSAGHTFAAVGEMRAAERTRARTLFATPHRDDESISTSQFILLCISLRVRPFSEKQTLKN
jgi:hypothetical protein